MEYKCKISAHSTLLAWNISNIDAFQTPRTLHFIKDHVLETWGGKKMECARGKKRSHFFRISKTGLLCQVSFDGDKTELMNVIRGWCLRSENDPGKKGTSHWKHLLPEHFETSQPLSGKAESSGGIIQELFCSRVYSVQHIRLFYHQGWLKFPWISQWRRSKSGWLRGWSRLTHDPRAHRILMLS